MYVNKTQRVVQVAINSMVAEGYTANETVCALTNDGSVYLGWWEHVSGKKNATWKWRQLPKITTEVEQVKGEHDDE